MRINISPGAFTAPQPGSRSHNATSFCLPPLVLLRPPWRLVLRANKLYHAEWEVDKGRTAHLTPRESAVRLGVEAPYDGQVEHEHGELAALGDAVAVGEQGQAVGPGHPREHVARLHPRAGREEAAVARRG